MIQTPLGAHVHVVSRQAACPEPLRAPLPAAAGRLAVARPCYTSTALWRGPRSPPLIPVSALGAHAEHTKFCPLGSWCTMAAADSIFSEAGCELALPPLNAARGRRRPGAPGPVPPQTAPTPRALRAAMRVASTEMRAKKPPSPPAA